MFYAGAKEGGEKREITAWMGSGGGEKQTGPSTVQKHGEQRPSEDVSLSLHCWALMGTWSFPGSPVSLLSASSREASLSGGMICSAGSCGRPNSCSAAGQ